MRLRPNLFVIGAQKAGTTTLWEYLDRHPEIAMCEPKEPNHFTLGRYDLDGYLTLFADAGDSKYRGDATTRNALTRIYPEVPGAIADMSPEARIIYVLRDPVRRLESSWVQGRSQLNANIGPFDEAIRTDPLFIEGSRYWTNLQAYRRLFDDGSILILFFEDLVRDPARLSAELWEFLGVAQLADDIGTIRANPSEGKTRVTLPGRLLQASGLADLGRKVIPPGPRQAIRRMISRRIEPATWNPETLGWVHRELADEARAVLDFCGRPADFWALEPSWSVDT